MAKIAISRAAAKLTALPQLAFRQLDHAYGNDPLQFFRARYVFVLNSMVSAILVVFIAFFGLSSYEIIDFQAKLVFCPLLLLQVSAYVYSNYRLLQGQFEIARSMVLATALLVTFCAVFLTGGFPGSVALPCLYLPALQAVLLYGRGVGLAIGAATCAVVLLQSLAVRYFGVVMPDYTSATNPETNTGLVNFTVFAVTMATIGLYDRINQQLRLALDRERSRFAELAHCDELTGLENARGFNRKLREVSETARATSGEMAVLYLDLDDFKIVNDTGGHDAGDAVLAETAQRIRGAIRSQDMAARIGGDEFAVIMPSPVHRRDVEGLIQRLRAAITTPVVYGEAAYRVGVSIGVEFFGQHNMSVADLIKSVDEAMYRDKLSKLERLQQPVGDRAGQVRSSVRTAA